MSLQTRFCPPSGRKSGPGGLSMTGHAIHIKLDGRTYSGTYKVDRQILSVTTSYGKKTATVLPRVAHEALARELLELLVREEKARKGSIL
jgi:hypothetical protein